MSPLDYSLVRLFSNSVVAVSDHITHLSSDDKYLRFGYSISDDQIVNYVCSTLTTHNTREHADFWFGIVESDNLLATIHIAIRGDVAEFAFTTDEQCRGKKLGQLLFARGYQMVCEYGISRIYVACLSKNGPMRRIASKFGMTVMTFGSDSEASVNIQYPVPLSRINEVTMSIIDKGILTNER